MTELRATLRLQLHRNFNFSAVEAQLPYFSRLGISHLYLSPILTARSGSLHGYDVVDYSAVSPELGGEAGYRRLVAAARQYGMGIIVDIVPNHMAVGHHDNAMWLDVLEWGRSSRYATFFDIDWDVPDIRLRHKVLLPFLAGQYGDVLEEGGLQLRYNALQGRFYIQYFDHHFPLDPASYPLVLHDTGKVLTQWVRTMQHALRGGSAARRTQFEQIRAALADSAHRDPEVAAALQQALARWSLQHAAGRRRLHRLLERQHYRLAWWRTAADAINWRRFFDVTDLAGVRVQEPAAFELVHHTTLRLYAEGMIDGLRIDHIDGLADPRNYCRRLRRRLIRLSRGRPPDAPRLRPLIFVEKILAPGEQLAETWQVDGTTGYSFMNDVSALLHNAAGERSLTRLWERFAPHRESFSEVEREARRRISQELLGADFNACAHALRQVAWTSPHTRDWTHAAIRRVLKEILAQFPVYRIYADAQGRSDTDEAIMAATIAAAMPFCRPAERPLLVQIDRWLGGEPPRDVHPASARRARLRAIARFQQLSSPVAAKAVEDTAFYRHGRLLSRNEVGADPGEFSIPAAVFTDRCRRRLNHYPLALLATATHDHKRGEDVRMRLAVLSEVPDLWAEVVEDWHRQHGPLKTRVNGAPAPDPIDEYMLYQMLAGAWPLTLAPQAGPDLDHFRERIEAWQQKAVREAKRLSGWTEPNEAYETAIARFLHVLLSAEHSSAFLASLHRLVERISVAGALNSLAQTLIKYTVPGVPDLYQGTEFWDFSLVDPDNRRPVDYAQRAAALGEDASITLLLQQWRNGHIKQQLIHRILVLRHQQPGLFTRGSYDELNAIGPRSAQLFVALRRYRHQQMLATVPRFVSRLLTPGLPMVLPRHWSGTDIPLPLSLHGSQWRDALGNAEPIHAGDRLPVEHLLQEWPVGLWYSAT